MFTISQFNVKALGVEASMMLGPRPERGFPHRGFGATAGRDLEAKNASDMKECMSMAGCHPVIQGRCALIWLLPAKLRMHLWVPKRPSQPRASRDRRTSASVSTSGRLQKAKRT